jgi:hypothetical protein
MSVGRRHQASWRFRFAGFEPGDLLGRGAIINAILRTDLDAPRKQRHTMTRIYDRLIAEHDMQGVSYSVVRWYVADRRPKIKIEAGRRPVIVFFSQTHRPGEEAEVDFGQVTISLRGEPVTCMLFALRQSYPARPSTGSSPPAGPTSRC